MITTLGLLSAAFLLLRRRFDSLLFWLTLFALLYGTHLMMQYQLLWWLGRRPEAFRRIVVAIEFLVPLPAFFFFDTLGLLGRAGRIHASMTITSLQASNGAKSYAVKGHPFDLNLSPREKGDLIAFLKTL